MVVERYDCRCGGRFTANSQQKHHKTKRHMSYSYKIYNSIRNRIKYRKGCIRMEEYRIKAIEEKRISDEQFDKLRDDICYLSVPFEEKDEAKMFGCMWDFQFRKWYISSYNKHFEDCVYRWYPNTSFEIKGEDRTYGGNDLFVDMIPSTSYFSNARKFLSSRDWDMVRNYVYRRVGNICECCHIANKLEAHERWYYDWKTGRQILVRIVGLCADCHQVTHLGHSRHRGLGKKCFGHLKRVRGFTDDETHDHIKEAYDTFHDRSRCDWKLDLSLLVNNGIKLITKC